MDRDLGTQVSLAKHGIDFDLPGRRILHDGREIYLTPIELRLVLQLASNPGQVFSREELLRSVHEDGTIVLPRTVDVHVKSIRKKLAVECIATIRGKGYTFVLPKADCESDEHLTHDT